MPSRIFAPGLLDRQVVLVTGGGSGLGLSINRDLARAQDGELTAENATGSTDSTSRAIFRLKLPKQ